MWTAESAAARLPEGPQEEPPAGSTQYWTRSGAPARSLSLAHAMMALPPESTATDGPGGWMSNGVAMLSALPAANAFAQNTTATTAASPQLSHTRRTLTARPN